MYLIHTYIYIYIYICSQAPPSPIRNPYPLSPKPHAPRTAPNPDKPGGPKPHHGGGGGVALTLRPPLPPPGPSAAGGSAESLEHHIIVVQVQGNCHYGDRCAWSESSLTCSQWGAVGTTQPCGVNYAKYIYVYPYMYLVYII